MFHTQGDARAAERRARARTRWLLAYTLLKNPSLRVYRKDKDDGSGARKAPKSARGPTSRGGKRGKGEPGDITQIENPLRARN